MVSNPDIVAHFYHPSLHGLCPDQHTPAWLTLRTGFPGEGCHGEVVHCCGTRESRYVPAVQSAVLRLAFDRITQAEGKCVWSPLLLNPVNRAIDEVQIGIHRQAPPETRATTGDHAPLEQMCRSVRRKGSVVYIELRAGLKHGCHRFGGDQFDVTPSSSYDPTL